jgi:hypothetical protein
LDTKSDHRFDHIVQMCAKLMGAPLAAVSMVASKRQWFKTQIGLDVAETRRDNSFCAWTFVPHALETFVVYDATKDARFKNNPLVTGPPYIRFYAGAPIVLSLRSGQQVRLGALCVLDTVPYSPDTFTRVDEEVLVNVASLVAMELRKRLKDDSNELGLDVSGNDLLQSPMSQPKLQYSARQNNAAREAILLLDTAVVFVPVVYANETMTQFCALEDGHVHCEPTFLGADGRPGVLSGEAYSFWDLFRCVDQDIASPEQFLLRLRERTTMSARLRAVRTGERVWCRFICVSEPYDIHSDSVRLTSSVKTLKYRDYYFATIVCQDFTQPTTGFSDVELLQLSSVGKFSRVFEARWSGAPA